jgi:hypothetical protein
MCQFSLVRFQKREVKFVAFGGYRKTRDAASRNFIAKSTRPSRSGDPEQNSPGHPFSGFALENARQAIPPNP